MTKTSDAQKAAVKNYDSNSKQVPLKYTPNQRKEYDRLKKYCDSNNIPVQRYIKELVERDLDNKGIEHE